MRNNIAMQVDKILTIIIPNYNNSKTIERCLNSILDQINETIEIIVIDDGSTDDSLLVLDKYKKKIRIISQTNCGVGEARNRGIDEANGKYIWFVDADDEILPNALNDVFLNQLQQKNIDVYLFGLLKVSNIRRDKLVNTSSDILSNKELGTKYDKIFSENLVKPVWNKIYLKCFLKSKGLKFKKYKLGEDVIFNYEVMRSLNTIKIVDEAKYVYYTDNISSSKYQVDKEYSNNISFRLHELKKTLMKLKVPQVKKILVEEIIDILLGEEVIAFNTIKSSKQKKYKFYKRELTSDIVKKLRNKVQIKEVSKKYIPKLIISKSNILSYIYWRSKLS